MTHSTDTQAHSLLKSATTLAKTLVTMLHTRLHLLAIDLEEDRLYLLQMLKYGLLALFCFAIGIIALTVFVAVLFWETHRLLVLASIAAVFLLAGVLCWRYATCIIKAKPSLFSNSLTELVKDAQSLEDGTLTPMSPPTSPPL